MANESVLKNFYYSERLVSPIQQNLIKILRTQGPLTRRELVSQLSRPRTTIFDNLLKLQKIKIVEKFSRNSGTRGRPLTYWKIKE